LLANWIDPIYCFVNLPHWITQITDAVGRDAEASKAVIFHVHVSTMNSRTSSVGQAWLRWRKIFGYWWGFVNVINLVRYIMLQVQVVKGSSWISLKDIIPWKEWKGKKCVHLMKKPFREATLEVHRNLLSQGLRLGTSTKKRDKNSFIDLQTTVLSIYHTFMSKQTFRWENEKFTSRVCVYTIHMMDHPFITNLNYGNFSVKCGSWGEVKLKEKFCNLTFP
jgi:hypothetical protein